tara:strand:+ start:15689 stop:16006 length:318 start_codon:yes stop_codon:yes gene_type:complete
MKFLLYILLLTSILFASELPRPKKEFTLTYWDMRKLIYAEIPKGKVVVEFYVNERGEVEDPIIIDTFNVNLNDIILNKVKQSTYYPAIQNGKPVKVKYSLPIQFK